MSSASKAIALKFVTPPLFALFVALCAHSLFFQKGHDWDLDAFLYLGSRLHEGELLYLADFETKLPLLQYLFAVASALGGIGAWRLLTLVAAAGLGIAASYVLAADYLRRTPAKATTRTTLASFLTALYLSALYALPGSESAHIEVAAASAAYMSFALMIDDARGGAAQRRQFGAGIFLALAALIRPNYVYLVPFCALWAYWRAKKEDCSPSGIPSAVAFAGGFGVTVLGSFLPYLFVANGVGALADGLRALARFGEGASVAWLADAQMGRSTILFFLPAYIASTLVLAGLIRDRKNIGQSVFWIYGAPAVAAILLINFSLLRNHYWPHNAIMFVPYAIPLAMVLLAQIPSASARAPKWRLAGVAGAALLLMMSLNPGVAFVEAAADVVRGRSEFDPRINRRRIEPRLLAFLATQKARGTSFLAADEPIYHMLLAEPRIGDGHPAMMMYVMRGKRIGPVARIPLYSDAVHANPCLAVAESGKATIVLRKNSYLSALIGKCLSQEPTGYRRIAVSGLDDLTIYVRDVPARR